MTSIIMIIMITMIIATPKLLLDLRGVLLLQLHLGDEVGWKLAVARNVM